MIQISVCVKCFHGCNGHVTCIFSKPSGGPFLSTNNFRLCKDSGPASTFNQGPQRLPLDRLHLHLPGARLPAETWRHPALVEPGPRAHSLQDSGAPGVRGPGLWVRVTLSLATCPSGKVWTACFFSLIESFLLCGGGDAGDDGGGAWPTTSAGWWGQTHISWEWS